MSGREDRMDSAGRKPEWDQREPLTDDDILWFIANADSQAGTQMSGHAKYVARFALEQIRAVRRFEKSSGRLTSVLIVMTSVLIILTGVLTYFTIVLARKR
jgi:hypothetical protein